MEKAIEKAIDIGGYEVPAWALVGWERGTKYQWRSFLIDSLFWQALGKAEGWQEKTDKILGTEIGFSPPELTWKYQWHRLIDHLAEGKDAESFFTNLLK